MRCQSCLWLIPFGMLLGIGCGGGTTTGSGGTGGSGGLSGGGANEDAQLTYEGAPLILDTVNVCGFATDGTDSVVSAAIQSETVAPNQVLVTFGSVAEPFPGTDIADTLSTQGSVSGLEVSVVGQLDLVDFDPDLVQLLDGGTCTVDFTFDRTMSLGASISLDVYEISFDCPMVTYDWLNTASAMPQGDGVLTNFSGTFPCFMSTF